MTVKICHIFTILHISTSIIQLSFRPFALYPLQIVKLTFIALFLSFHVLLNLCIFPIYPLDSLISFVLISIYFAQFLISTYLFPSIFDLIDAELLSFYLHSPS